MTLNYGAPFGFLFNDKAWFKKLAVASLLTCTIIGAAPVFGWTIQIIRRIHSGEEDPVPEFSDWKTYWNLGGKFALVNAVWLLPLLLAVIIIYLPLVFVSRLPDEVVLAAFAATACCVSLFLLVYSVVYIFFVPAMMVLLAKTGSTSQAMNPVRLWRAVRPQFTGYLIVFLIVGVGLLNLVLLVTPLTLFLLLPPMLVYTGLVTAHYAGQLAQSG
jgi:lipoprotein signal peptidase